MGFGGYGGQGGSRRPGRRPQMEQRTLIIVVIAVAVGLILWRTHRITSQEVIYFLVLIPSIILHELSHGVVALAFGDDTAKRSGRLTLNPVKHVDPIGTLLVPAVLSLSGIGAYGWAKPVPVSTNRLRSPRNQTVIVSLVGPLTNAILAALMGVIYVLVTPLATRQGYAELGLVSQIFFLAGVANIVLGVFNLIPCPPLDGAAVLERLLPARLLPEYYRIQPALMFLPLILILLFRNEWSSFINHIINWWASLLV
jgi:Zn-dependent protease